MDRCPENDFLVAKDPLLLLFLPAILRSPISKKSWDFQIILHNCSSQFTERARAPYLAGYQLKGLQATVFTLYGSAILRMRIFSDFT